MGVLEVLKQSVIEMEVEKAAKLTQKALDEGFDAEEVLNGALIPAMVVVGEQYERGERYIPETLLSAHSMRGAMEKLQPLLAKARVEPKGRVIIGTVEGDLHDIGKNLVAMMLEGAGFEVYDLGIDLPAGRFVEGAKKHKVDLVGASALLTTTMVRFREVLEALEESGLRDKVRVMVGGAPVTQWYADEVGADGYAPDAASAVKLAERLTTELKSKAVTAG
jgi:5-methyltetrahydrofolate--homocysteine methyltransferase